MGGSLFSALSLETHAHSRRGHTLHARIKALGTLTAGIMAAASGIILGQRV
jgi:fluoride ion exporter CrcB/FEX